MTIAFLIRIPKPIGNRNIYDEMNEWLTTMAPPSFTDRHWEPLGISEPQYRDYQLDILDDQTATMFKLVFAEYILKTIRIK